MCGIVGFIDLALTGADEAALVLARMRGAIRHRGPDDEGQIAAGGVGLGIQRLSIVDLATGHQPMLSADGKIWLVFNGEIYNHTELRARLEAGGRRFRTRSDTEVILAQYEHFGLDGIGDLNGMFAFAIWDARSANCTSCAIAGRQAAVLFQRRQAFLLFIRDQGAAGGRAIHMRT